jgi:hypothetical protein
LSGLNNDPNTILYRQNILKDCLKNSSIVRDIYDIAVEAIESKRKSWYGFLSEYPHSILYNARSALQLFVGFLKKLKNVADEHADKFESEGFTAFFETLNKELNDEFFVNVQNHLRELKFRNGVLISAELGAGNKGTDYILRKPKDKKQSWMQLIFSEIKSWMGQIFSQKTLGYTFYISERDEAGARALEELKDRGINLVANTLAQSADHIDSFFKMLCIELAFYIGCLNLHEQLAQMGEPISFPLPMVSNERRHYTISV